MTEKTKKYHREYYQKNKIKHQIICKEWRRKNKEKYNLINAEWKKNNKDKVRKYRFYSTRKIKYGLSREQYDQMLISQDNKCAICGNLLKTPYVDHNHITNKVRNLLCNKCNLVLGLVNENKLILQNAINYLDKWSVNE